MNVRNCILAFIGFKPKQGADVYNIWGGVIDWAWHNGELATLTGKLTRKVHTHGKRWNLLPPAYGAMW